MAEPAESNLITGVKRDISLLKRVDAKVGDRVNVLDISLDKNRQPLMSLLERQVEVFYADHHQATDIPINPLLTALINTDANVCTSLLIDQHLGHRFTAWAVTAAFGDNLTGRAFSVAEGLKLSSNQIESLRQLGICLNYNGYGSNLDDLNFAPDVLYRVLYGYESPLDFMVDRIDIYQALLDGYTDDMRLANRTKAEFKTENVALFILPDEKWARRVSGVWSNELANLNPNRAHAVLSLNEQGGYLVSVRAPLNNKAGADALCAKYPSGGGRMAAAGINNLESDRLSDFMDAFVSAYS
ncbi:DHH family phosphoesterase [Methylomonas sp.]|uniref:DHH family phosphoesterase n=1 Tax=Methylomonas sp. TaxID=418 RepID=UPI00341BF4BF